MHPTHHQYRRELRAQYLQKRYPPGQNTLFVDAAEYRHKTAFAIVVTKGTDEPPVHAITIRTKNPAEAEEAAIAVALTQRPTPPTIISDSKTAIQNFAQGNISSLALKILQKNPPLTPVDILWTPAHAGQEGNETAHSQARDLTFRAGVAPDPSHGARSSRDSLLNYTDITEHYRLCRRKLAPPHPELTTAQEQDWRLIQTNTYPHPTRLHLIHPTQVPSPNCTLCTAPATLPHILWACPQNPYPRITTAEQWREALASHDREVQTSLIARAASVVVGLITTTTNFSR